MRVYITFIHTETQIHVIATKEKKGATELKFNSRIQMNLIIRLEFNRNDEKSDEPEKKIDYEYFDQEH